MQTPCQAFALHHEDIACGKEGEVFDGPGLLFTLWLRLLIQCFSSTRYYSEELIEHTPVCLIS